MIKILLYSFLFFVKKDSCLTLNCVNNNTIQLLKITFLKKGIVQVLI